MKTESTAQGLEVPFVDLKEQWRRLAGEIRPILDRVLEEANFILSPDVEQFEKAFAAFIGAKYCVGVASGTDAILLALLACGVGEADEVLVPTNTYVATVAAICHGRAKPVFVDVDPNTFLMDLRDTKAKWTKKTRAVIPVHLYGRAMDLKELSGWCKERRLKIIEDACQAHGAQGECGKAGSMGEIGCFSFYPGKNLGCYGDGGAIVTNDANIARTIAELRNQGQREKCIHNHKGYNSRLDSLQAAILSVKLRHLEEFNRLRRQWAAYYDEKLAGVSEVIRPSWNRSRPQEHVFHLYVIRVPRRDSLLAHLRSHGVSAQIHYPIPVHLQEGYSDLGFGKGDIPVAEKIAGEIISLPIYPELTGEKIDYVVAQIKDFYTK